MSEQAKMVKYAREMGNWQVDRILGRGGCGVVAKIKFQCGMELRVHPAYLCYKMCRDQVKRNSYEGVKYWYQELLKRAPSLKQQIG